MNLQALDDINKNQWTNLVSRKTTLLIQFTIFNDPNTQVISKFMLNHFTIGEKTTIYGKVVLTKLFSAVEATLLLMT